MSVRLIPFLILALTVMSSDSAAPDDEFSIMIKDCLTGVKLEVKGDMYHLSSDWPRRVDSVKIDRKDLAKLKASVQDIFKTSGDEFLSVYCIADGFHNKLFLQLNEQTKKIYIGNYFDLRYNEIALVLNQYLPAGSEYLFRLPYGITDPEEIKKALKRSENDPEKNPECQAPDHIKHEMLHEWCEL